MGGGRLCLLRACCAEGFERAFYTSPEEENMPPQVIKDTSRFALQMVDPTAAGNECSCIEDCATQLEAAELLMDKARYDAAAVEFAEDTPQIITSSRPPYRVVDVNEKWLNFCGYSRNEVVGKTLDLLQGERTNYEDLKPMMEGIRARKPSECKVLNYTKCGTEFLNEIEVEPIEVDGPFFLATTRKWTKTSDDYFKGDKQTWQSIAPLDDSHVFEKGELKVGNRANAVKFPTRRARRREAAVGSMLPASALGTTLPTTTKLDNKTALWPDQTEVMEELYSPTDMGTTTGG